MSPLSFTDHQIAQLKMVAAMLPANARDNFLRSISSRLVDLPYPPSDADVQAAIDFVLSCRGITRGFAVHQQQDHRQGRRSSRADRCFRTGVSQ